MIKPVVGGLGSKIIIAIVLANALLSAVASGVQLQDSFQRDRARVVDKFQIIESRFRHVLQNALWEINSDQVKLLITGIYSEPDVQHVELHATTGEHWEKRILDEASQLLSDIGSVPKALPASIGSASDNELIFRDINLHHMDRNGTEQVIGVLTIGLTLNAVKARIWAQFITLLTSNFVKASLASVVMLIIFNHLVSRHLRAIASHVSGLDWLATTQELSLVREAGNRSRDELDDIVVAINSAQTSNLEAITSLETEIAKRTKAQLALAEKTDDLEQTNIKLQQINQEQAEFTYSISHDLKSPINTISMLLGELSLSHCAELGSEGSDLLNLSKKTIERMGLMVDDVLGYSQTIETDQSVEPVSIQLNSLLESVVSDLGGDIKIANAKVEIGSLPTLRGNPILLRILFQNLLSNAIKFRAVDRQPVIEIQQLNSESSELSKIIVRDNGIGIAPEYHSEIFGLFNRLHTRDKYPGTGLGLALCKRIVVDHGGTIFLKSALGKGTTFEITLRSTTT